MPAKTAESTEARRLRAKQNARARDFERKMSWTRDPKETRALRERLAEQIANVLPFVMRSEKLVRMAVSFPPYTENAVMLGCLDYPDGWLAVRQTHHETEVRATFEALGSRSRPVTSNRIRLSTVTLPQPRILPKR